MEENFELVAQTRANYYTPGSPVQFACVELLRGSESGEQAVCLTFRNVSRVTLTALEIHFKCKGADGAVLCEDDFEYRDLDAKPGESFGMDDAVFVTSKAISSVDITLKNVYNGKRVVHLDAIKRVRLPAPKRLSPEVQAALEARMERKGMKYMPQMLENGGWYCACGTFHPKEEDTVYCTACGSDRILLQNALNSLLQPQPKAEQPTGEAPAQPKATEPAQREDEATRVMPQHGYAAPAAQAHAAEQAAPARRAEPQPQYEEEATREVTPAHSARAAAPAEARPQRQPEPKREKYAAPYADRAAAAADDEADDGDESDSMAEALIRWVPPITAILCAAIALCGFVYYQFLM